MSVSFSPIKEIAMSANTGLDAIKRAPIVDYDTGIKCLRIQDVSQSKAFSNWGFTDVEERNYKKFQLKENDILIARTGASIGVNRFISGDAQAVFNNGLIRIRVDTKKCFPKYLFYNFRTTDYQGFIESISGGTSTQPNMQIGALLSFEIYLPELEEQKAITAVLNSLDDKIDLLHRQNTTLERMAETLFRQWFVEEVQEDWEEVSFGEFVTPKKGKNITKAEAIEGIYPVVAGGLTPSCFHNKANTNAPVITISASGANAGFVCLHHSPVWSSDSSYIDNTISKYVYFCYVFLKYNQGILTDKQEGSAQPHIYPSHIMDLATMNYPLSLIETFENQIKEFFEKIKTNQQQIQTLEKLRDNLLPKLMSGEVRVGVAG